MEKDKRAVGEDAAVSAPKRARVFEEVYGADATAELQLQLDQLPADRARVLKAPDVQELLLWCLSETIPAPKWFFLKNRPLLERVLFILAEGLGEDVGAACASLFPGRAAFKAPGDRRSFVDPLPLIITCNGVHVKKNKKAKKREAARVAAAGTWSVADLMMTDEQLQENSYPIPGLPIRSAAHRDIPLAEFLDMTKAELTAAEEGALPHLLAVDCEMCRTNIGLELARVAVVDAEGRTLLDELVQPSRPVLDHNTRWSGITAEMLAPVKTTLAEVRERLVKLVRRDTVLVGHSLENDLLALRMMHTRVIDTAIVFPALRGGMGAKCSLRSLAQRHLGLAIQHATHDATEDACAAMRLVQHKLSEPRVNAEAHPSLFDVLAQSSPPCTATFVARPEVLPRAQQEGGRASLIGCLTDEAVIGTGLRQLQSNASTRSRLVMTHLSDLERAHASAIKAQGLADEATRATAHEAISVAHAQMTSHIHKLWSEAPKHTLVVVLTMHGSPVPLREALLVRRAAQGETAVLEADKLVENAAMQARNGIVLLGVKTTNPE